MVVSFSVDYMQNELRVFFLDEETEVLTELYADTYDWSSDSTEPQEGRIELHFCEHQDLVNLIGNRWNITVKPLDEGDEDGGGDAKELAKEEI